MEISVLVIDEHFIFNRALVSALRREGFNAEGCGDLLTAHQLFVRMNPDIILLDIILDGTKAFDLISCFRQQNNARILVMTEHDDIRSKRICYENGADDYRVKPFCQYEL
ncbi:MAG: response regulator, partial [Eubacteriales bacterium]|nr:response regulator [Eubacteriales bacterium]